MYLCMYSSLQKDSGIQEKGSDGVKEGKKDGKRKEKELCFLHLYSYFSELLDNRFRPRAPFSTSKYL